MSPRKKGAKLRVPTEHESQVAFFARVDMDPRTKDLPIFAIPNFSGRLGNLPPIAAIRQAQKLNAEGRKKGVPDILCATTDHLLESHGLFIEMKRKGEKRSPEQEQWGNLLQSHNYRVALCYSADEAWQTLCNYLGFPLTPDRR